MPAETPVIDRVKPTTIRNKKTNSKNINESQEFLGSKSTSIKKETTSVRWGLTWSWIKYFLHASLATSDMMFVKSLLDIADRLASGIYRRSERKWSQTGTWTILSLYFKHFLYKITTRKGFRSTIKKIKEYYARICGYFGFLAIVVF